MEALEQGERRWWARTPAAAFFGILVARATFKLRSPRIRTGVLCSVPVRRLAPVVALLSRKAGPNKESPHHFATTHTHKQNAQQSLATMSDAWKTVKPFVNGGASGMFATCLIQPIDMVKVRIQLGAKGSPVSFWF